MTPKERPLFDGEPRFRLFFDVAFEGIGISEAGKILDVNGRLAEMLGSTREDLVGRTVMSMVAPEDREQVEKAMREGHDQVYEHRVVRKDGTLIPVEVRGRAWELDGRSLRITAIRDISDRREALARIRESEERLRLLFDAAQDAYFVLDSDGRILEANHAAEVQLGYSREELYGKTHLDMGLVPKENRGSAERGLDLLRQGLAAGPLEISLIRKDGVRIFLEIESTPVTVHGEKLVLTVSRDVTIRKRVAERLSLLTKAVDASGEVVFLTDTDGVFTYVNPAFTELYGWEAEEVVGKKTPRILKSGLYGEDYYAGMWKTLRDGDVLEAEYKNRKRNGELVDIAGSANPVRNDSGEIVGFLAIQSDISARKKQEETLLAIARGVSGSTGESFFRDLAHHLCVAVRADVAILGRLAGEEGDEVETIAVEVGGEVRENFTYRLEGAPCERAITDGICIETRRVQQTFPRDVGLRRLEAEAYVGKALKDSEGDPLGVALVMFREPLLDPTLAVSMLEIFGARASAEMERSRAEAQRLRLQEQLRQAQKMEEIGQLTGGIAHDFQNLLSVILLNAELLKDALESGEPITLGEVREIEEAAQHAANMTRKLLGFGRRADLSMVPTDMGPVVRGMSSMLRRVIPETIDLEIRVEEGVGMVRADPGAVEQILLNLATNARDAMPGGGRLTLELKAVRVAAEDLLRIPEGREGDFLCLSVTDTGVGMEQQVLGRVFEPFFTTKPVGEGTGLGLAMAFGLAQQHGGFLHLESEVGRGTRVCLYIPRFQESTAEKTAAEERLPAVGGHETLLVVEDQPALRRTLKLVLERVGYRVLLAEHGEEALEVARAHADEIGLILSDLVMPRMGGVDLYRALREEGFDMPFIMASGYAGKSASGLAELDPSVPVLKKPWKPRELLHLVRTLLDGQGGH